MDISAVSKTVCVAAICLAPCLAVAAERHALLIGVSAYPALKEDLQLVGPQNDVQLMRDLLKGQGFADAHIRVLAEQVPGAKGLATRANILDELAGVAERAGKGDFVYLQFGGHGSQQPTRSGKVPAEPDGMDEIFMPRDIGKWDGSANTVQNAIRDEELGKAITAIRDKGAFVWAVFDNCHSGYITRGGGGSGNGLRERRLDPKALGIPQQAIDSAVAGAKRATVTSRGGKAAAAFGALAAKGEGGASSGRGGHVYFYATQPNETTPEMYLPEGSKERRSYGVFTYTLAQVIAANPGISYRQAGERMLQLYAAKNMRSPTPLFEGSALDAPLFGQQAGEAVRQWPITVKDGGFEIAAGAIQQFGEGALFKVFPNAAAKEGSEIAYFKAQNVDVMVSRLVAVAHGGKPVLGQVGLPQDAVARLADPALSLALKVAAPPQPPAGAAYDTAAKVIEQLRKASDSGLRIEWVKSGEAADLRLDYADAQLWLLPHDGAWIKVGAGKTASIRLDKPAEQLRESIVASLQQIAKVLNLTRLAGQSMAGPVGGKLDIRLAVIRRNDQREEISGAAVPTLFGGDKLQLTIRNNHYKPVDVTVLSTDSLYGVSLLYPHGAGEANRVGSLDTLTIPGEGEEPIVINADTVGRENIVVIAVEAEPQSVPVNLGFLEQPSLSQTRGGGAGDLAGVFMDAGFGGERTRGVGRSAPLAKTAFRVFNWITQPGQ